MGTVAFQRISFIAHESEASSLEDVGHRIYERTAGRQRIALIPLEQFLPSVIGKQLVPLCGSNPYLRVMQIPDTGIIQRLGQGSLAKFRSHAESVLSYIDQRPDIMEQQLLDERVDRYPLIADRIETMWHGTYLFLDFENLIGELDVISKPTQQATSVRILGFEMIGIIDQGSVVHTSGQRNDFRESDFIVRFQRKIGTLDVGTA